MICILDWKNRSEFLKNWCTIEKVSGYHDSACMTVNSRLIEPFLLHTFIPNISIRGRGRLEVAEVRGTTKKGRTVVLLKRYL